MNKANHKINAITKSKLLIYALRLQLTICHSNAKEKNEMKFQYSLSSSLSFWLIDNNEKHSYTLYIYNIYIVEMYECICVPENHIIILYPHRFQETMDDKISHNLKRQRALATGNWQQN